MSTLAHFTVDGVPAPQGSMKHVGGGRIVPSNASDLKRWREGVARIARHHYLGEPYDGAVELRLVFVLPRPKSRRKALHHVVRPDLDKLVRAVGDAITGVILKDDSRVARLDAVKVYGDAPGVVVTVVALDPQRDALSTAA